MEQLFNHFSYTVDHALIPDEGATNVAGIAIVGSICIA